jgi:hypothetical protein
VLLVQSAPVLAQSYAPPLRVQPDKVEVPSPLRSPAWTTLRLYGQQASFRFSHNNDDGLVVGMGLGRAQYSVLLELAPPVPTNSTQSERVLLPIPPDVPHLQPVHKLSLRYRF